MKKEGLGFDFDERTDVPTFEEVASVLPKIKKHKKTLVYILIMVVVIAVFGGGGFAIYKYRGNIQTFLSEGEGGQLTGSAIGGISGFITNDINYSDQNKFGVTIEEVKINLTNEEISLRDDLLTVCADEKTKLESSTRSSEKTQCTTEKSALKLEISDLEIQVSGLKEDVEKWKDKYNDYECAA